MIKIEKADTWGFEHAIRGMRNPMNSWNKSDSVKRVCDDKYIVGENDLDLMKRLTKAGTDHRKFLRQVIVSVDVTAPLYWWKEFDTYKVGTVANSCSTMHKIHTKEFSLDDFSHEHLIDTYILERVIEELNVYRMLFVYYDKQSAEYRKSYSKKDVWWQMIQLLPSSYNQKRTLTLNYEVLLNIYFARRNHKLDDWHTFCKWIETLPYMNDLLETLGGK